MAIDACADEEDDDELTDCVGCEGPYPIEELERCGSCNQFWCDDCWTPRNDDTYDPCPGCIHDADVIEEARHRY